LSGGDLAGAHDAANDVNALMQIFLHNNVWMFRSKHLLQYSNACARLEVDAAATNKGDEVASDVDPEDLPIVATEEPEVDDFDLEQYDEKDRARVEGWEKDCQKGVPDLKSVFKGPTPGPKNLRPPSHCNNIAYWLFMQFWSCTMRGVANLEVFCISESNRYAKAKRAAQTIKWMFDWRAGKRTNPVPKCRCRWVPLAAIQLRKFLAIILLAGIVGHDTNYLKWWSNNPYECWPVAMLIMPKDGFLSVLGCGTCM
jgi:hypothetical protein